MDGNHVADTSQMIRAILEAHGIRCPESPTLMACPQCGSVEEVCEKCRASIQATVRRADGWREWEQPGLFEGVIDEKEN